MTSDNLTLNVPPATCYLPPATLLLVRHGENEWMRSGKLAGRIPGVHLNEAGRAQAQRLAARLASWPIAAIYSSPLERCAETASILAAPHGLDLQFRDELLEADYGQWQGQELEALKKEALWQVVQTTPSFVVFPDGESMRSMQARVVEALHRIAANHPHQNVIVCSHADPIRAALSHFLGAHLDLFQRLQIDPASVSLVHFTRFGPRIGCVNDTGELLPPPPDPASETTSSNPTTSVTSHAQV